MWTDFFSKLPLQPPLNIQYWMQKPYQLAPALRKVCSKLTVEILQQNWGTLYEDEVHLLIKKYKDLEIVDYSDQTRCYLREVFINGDQVPFCYARVIILPEVYARYQTAFEQLGQQFIGETMLYSDHRTLRSAFQYACLNKDDPIFERLTCVLTPYECAASCYWGRRSVFYLRAVDPLLITEVFTPAIPSFFIQE